MWCENNQVKIIKADRDSVWGVLKKMDQWAEWDPTSSYCVIAHKCKQMETNVFICDEEEKFLFLKFRHKDEYTLLPKYKIIKEKILEGDFSGNFEMVLSDHPDGTSVSITANITPTKWWMERRAKPPPAIWPWTPARPST